MKLLSTTLFTSLVLTGALVSPLAAPQTRAQILWLRVLVTRLYALVALPASVTPEELLVAVVIAVEHSSATTRIAGGGADAGASHEAEGALTTVQLGDGTDVVGLDCIWHNINSESNFTTFRKFSGMSVDRMLVKVARHVEEGFYTIISLQASKHSFVVVCAFNKHWEDLPDDWFGDQE